MERGIWTQKSTQEEHHMKMKTVIGVVLLQVKECQRLPVSYQKHGPDSNSQFSEGTNPAYTLISDYHLPEW